MTHESIPRQMLLDYHAALAAADLAAFEGRLDEHSLFEIPFVKPNRLVGAHEIVQAHRDIFANLDRIEFVAARILGDDTHAIAEGQLRVERDARVTQFTAGFAAAVDGGHLRRLSLYCNARNVRPWSDRSIL